MSDKQVNGFIRLVKNPYFISCWFALAVVSYFFIDEPLAIYMHSIKASWFYNAAELITNLGYGSYYLIGFTLLIVIGFLLRKTRLAHASIYLLLSVVISGVLCDIFKFMFGRSRPTLLFSQHDYGFNFLQTHYNMVSFPSGHATTISAVMVGLTYLFPRGFWVWLVVLLLVSFTRVVVTAHFLSDIMVGMYLGAITSIFVADSLTKRFKLTMPMVDRV